MCLICRGVDFKASVWLTAVRLTVLFSCRCFFFGLHGCIIGVGD